ncbi:MAG: hypothetical protein F6J87_20245 [Spirulina sp. SIO3F2]|nr:hypothetical protein [Spirulina sp. SIO3F2]
MADYQFLTEWFFESPIHDVWSELEDFNAFPKWWKNWQRFELQGDDTNVGVGSRFDCAVRGALPYTIRYTLELTKLEPPYLNQHQASNGLVGVGKWLLKEQDGGTKVEHHWQVRTENPILNAIAQLPWIKKLMYNNHEGIMERGYHGMKVRLAQKA